jgi:hypothetical protein
MKPPLFRRRRERYRARAPVSDCSRLARKTISHADVAGAVYPAVAVAGEYNKVTDTWSSFQPPASGRRAVRRFAPSWYARGDVDLRRRGLHVARGACAALCAIHPQ